MTYTSDEYAHLESEARDAEAASYKQAMMVHDDGRCGGEKGDCPVCAAEEEMEAIRAELWREFGYV